MIRHDAYKLSGYLEVFRLRKGREPELLHSTKNTIYEDLQTNLRNVLISRSVEYGVDAVAWGSYDARGGTFVDSDWAGTTSSGTQGALKMTAVGSNQAKLSGTFNFSSTKLMNYFQVGRGYTPAGAGVDSLFTGLYGYDSSILTGSSSLQYDNGDAFVLNWFLNN